MFNYIFEKKIQDGFLEKCIGREFIDFDGVVWVLHSWNDLNVPYFNMKGKKKLYTHRQFGFDLIKLARRDNMA